MTVGDVFLLLVRWLHGMAAVAWVGGSLFYLLVLRPALRKGDEGAQQANPLVAAEFRGLVDTAVIVLVLTGAILSFDVLTSRYAGVPYTVILGVKVALALWMFHLAGVLRGRRARPSAPEQPASPGRAPGLLLRHRLSRALSAANLVVMVGVVVFLLADLLRVLFERAMATG